MPGMGETKVKPTRHPGLTHVCPLVAALSHTLSMGWSIPELRMIIRGSFPTWSRLREVKAHS